MLSPDTKVVRLLLSLAEFLPLLAFVYSGRLDADSSERFFWGAGTIVVIVPVLALFRWELNPLLVAVNIWLCIEALSFLVYIPVLVETRQVLRESAFFVAIILVGASYIAFSKRGLLTIDHDDQKRVRGCSFALLALAGGGLICSIAFRGDEMFSVVIPATVIFVAQMLVSAHLSDRSTSP